jgi:hypothetical protein
MPSTPLQWSNIIAALTFVLGRPPCPARPAPRNSDKCPVGEATLSLSAASVLAVFPAQPRGLTSKPAANSENPLARGVVIQFCITNRGLARGAHLSIRAGYFPKWHQRRGENT